MIMIIIILLLWVKCYFLRTWFIINYKLSSSYVIDLYSYDLNKKVDSKSEVIQSFYIVFYDIYK